MKKDIKVAESLEAVKPIDQDLQKVNEENKNNFDLEKEIKSLREELSNLKKSSKQEPLMVTNLPKDTTINKNDKKRDYDYQRDKEREMVSGIVKNHECPGGTIEFVFRKWKGDPITKYSFFDGQVARVPLGVARHLNNNCWYPVHAATQDKDGKESYKIGRKVRRFGFQSLEFLDQNDLNSYGTSDTSLVSIERAVMPLSV
jgi:hypothetical protein